MDNKTSDGTARSILYIRRIVQVAMFIFINYVLIELIFSVNLISLEAFIKVFPVLNSPRNPLSNGSGIVEFIFYFISQGIFPLFLIGLFILIILLTNRFFCGWICPIGTIQDGLAALPIEKKTFKISTHQFLLKIKYVIIILLIIIIVPLGISYITSPTFYTEFLANLGVFGQRPVSFFSLSEFIFVFFPNMISSIWQSAGLGPLFADFWTFIIFISYIIVLILAVYYPRFYCRYICPFAALSSAISPFSFLKLTRSPVKCVGRQDCGICEKVCPKQIRILDEPYEFFTGEGECNLCLKCKAECPYSALTVKFG